MTADEARACIVDVKNHVIKLRQALHDLYTRQGWRALGYASFKDCAEREFGKSYQYMYRQLVAHRLDQQLSPGGEFAIPEKHARILTALPENRRVDAYHRAQQLAAAEQGELTARHIEQAVQTVATEMRVQASRYVVLRHMVASGHVSVVVADTIAANLEAFKPQTRAYLLQLLARAGAWADAALLALIGQQYEAREQVASAALFIETLDRSGCVGNTPLRRANLTDGKRALYEAHLEAESDATHEEDDHEPIHLTLWEGDIEGSWQELKKMMSEAWIDAMRMKFMEA